MKVLQWLLACAALGLVLGLVFVWVVAERSETAAPLPTVSAALDAVRDRPDVTYDEPRLIETVSRYERRASALASAETLGNVGDPWRDQESLDARGRVAVAMRAQRAAEQRALAAQQAAQSAESAREQVQSAPAPSAPAPAPVVTGDVWSRLAQCESGGNPRAVSPSGAYRGAFQFDLSTWASVGMSGDPIDHSYADQLAAAQRLHASRGFQPWPACRASLGLP